MMLYIYLILIILIGLFMAIREAIGSRKELMNRKSPKQITKEAFGTFGVVQLAGIIVGSLLFGIFATAARLGGNNYEVQVTQVEVYHLAPDSKFENTDEDITFTFINETDKLEAKHVEFDSIRVFDGSNDTLVVSDEDVTRKWLFPWVMDSKTVVSIH